MADGSLFRGMPFWEATAGNRSPRVSRGPERSTATREIYVNWEDVERFAMEAIGYSYVGITPGTLEPYVARQIPWSFPLISRAASGAGPAPVDSMYCERFDYEGFGADPGDGNPLGVDQFNGFNAAVNGNIDNGIMAKYGKAKCTLTYGTPTYDIKQDGLVQYNDESTWYRYVTKLVRPQGEFITITGGNNAYYVAGVALGANPMPFGQTVNKIIASCNYSVTWHNVPSEAVPMAEYNPSNATSTTSNTNVNTAIDKCLGRVNNALFNGCPIATLLLLAVEIKPLKNVLGRRIYDITYMFKKANQGDPYPNNSFLLRPQPTIITPGHNHLFFPAVRFVGTNFYDRATMGGLNNGGNTTPPAGWYEVVSGSAIAQTNPYTNIPSGYQQPGVNIYDYANFANLFRPVTWPR